MRYIIKFVFIICMIQELHATSVGDIIVQSSLTQEELNYVLNFDLNPYKSYKVENLGLFYIDVTDDMIKGHLSTGKIWEEEIHELIKYFVKPGSTAIDVGSMVGCHTIAMSHAVGKYGKVIAFEPCLKIFTECAYNLVINDCNNVNLYHYALLEKNDQGIVHVHVNGEAINYVEYKINKTSTSWVTENIQIRTLDSFNFNNVSLIKIDVEGKQDAVLLGGINTIRKNKPIIIIEALNPFLFTEHLTNKFLEELGYVVIHIGYSDLLAIPKSSKGSI